MATRASDLVEPSHIEQLRLELIEALAATLAYPPFFDFRSGELRSRPIDRAKVAEIEQFIGSANLDGLTRASPSSPDTRRMLERLALRYLDVNPVLATPAGRRYLPLLRARATKLAADTHRRFTAHLSGGERDFGARRQAASWSVAKRASRRVSQDSEHISRVLEAASAPHAHSGPHAGAPKGSASAASQPNSPAGSMAAPPPPTISPFAAPPRTPTASDLTDQPTGPLSAYPALGGPGANTQSARNPAMRELPPDLLNLYGDYLSDLEPGARAPRPAAGAISPAPPQPPVRMGPPAPPPYQPAAASPPVQPPSTPPGPADARGDQLIFWQLRYQLEAYVRLAARSYGLPGHGGDPSMVLDELRRSGFVDEADLRIAEGVFALTDRVTAQGTATTADYRQALMLYLLYHRSHINA